MGDENARGYRSGDRVVIRDYSAELDARFSSVLVIDRRETADKGAAPHQPDVGRIIASVVEELRVLNYLDAIGTLATIVTENAMLDQAGAVDSRSAAAWPSGVTTERAVAHGATIGHGSPVVGPKNFETPMKSRGFDLRIEESARFSGGPAAVADDSKGEAAELYGPPPEDAEL